jgi:TonB family protein
MQISFPSIKLMPSILLNNGWLLPIVLSILLHITLLFNSEMEQKTYTVAIPSVSNVSFSIAKSSSSEEVREKGIKRKPTNKMIVQNNDTKDAKAQDVPIVLTQNLGITEISPKYPRRAIEFNWQGKTVVLARVVNGVKQEIVLHTSSGYNILDHSAVNAVKSWSVPQNIRGGEYWVKIPIEFQIKQN